VHNECEAIFKKKFKKLSEVADFNSQSKRDF
jgi:hypothetical protein